MEFRFSAFITVLVTLLLISAVHIEAAVGPGRPYRPRRGYQETQATTWAVLVAGSNGFHNYRHQADICHAYQVLKRGGLKDENIVVFMYDDIANNEENPKPGTIINRPHGEDVYAGVPKDYTGEDATVKNFYAVILGNRSALNGGSGKVLDSKPSDRIFIYYSDHGAPGILTMPNLPYLHAKDFIDVLQQKHGSGSYKEMVIYVEACEAGSIFEGLLPENINIYVTTASNAEESSYATYCYDPEFNGICLGDLYSVAWMEHSETHDRKNLKLEEQYLAVKQRTSQNNRYETGSHVMEYGYESIREETLDLFQGYDPNFARTLFQRDYQSNAQMERLSQEDASLLFLWYRYKASKDGSEKKTQLLKQLTDEVRHRNHLDGSVGLIGMFLFGPSKHHAILNSSRAPGSPLVDDWECQKSMIRVFETHCGSLSRYGLKHARAFANLCNNGVSKAAMEEACVAACSGHDLGKWDPSKIGYTA